MTGGCSQTVVLNVSVDDVVVRVKILTSTIARREVSTTDSTSYIPSPRLVKSPRSFQLPATRAVHCARNPISDGSAEGCYVRNGRLFTSMLLPRELLLYDNDGMRDSRSRAVERSE